MATSKNMAIKSEQKITADNAMWLTHPGRLEQLLDCQKPIKHKVHALEVYIKK